MARFANVRNQSERFVVIVDLWQIRVSKMFAKMRNFPPCFGSNLPAALRCQPPLPFLLIFPFLWITNPGFVSTLLNQRIHTITAGPDVLQVTEQVWATDTFIEVQHHAYLCANFHDADSFFQFTF